MQDEGVLGGLLQVGLQEAHHVLSTPEHLGAHAAGVQVLVYLHHLRVPGVVSATHHALVHQHFYFLLEGL